MKNYKIPTLTIAGSDSSGGAGIQADLKTFSAIGTYGMSVITAITAQNTQGVFYVEELSSKIIKEQIKAVCEDIQPKAIKVGMVSSPEIIKDIVESLEKYPCKYLVVDPVMISKSGYSLLKPEAKDNLIKYLIPKAYIVTPNIPEAEEISNIKINTVEDMKKVGKAILDLGSKFVLMKGGHLDGDCVDVLMGEDTFEVYKCERINKKNTHGTGCTISSAITSHLALGYDIKESVKLSKEYITEAIKHSFDIGQGVGPVHHFYKFD
ncbi:bifunctional hydroxymethylpyrimidine kinase/phosphomethylpyrimidine kinase [Terrisporobacter glycolicus]|uniref:Hydroxymethylpyrimidine/phosphomethylpyrimidine kinase n=1 Tax=Terrisporobacter glycolicus ATCC 14880 = DSM 1288 TaxID=1121315 RepID=A0ABZ2EUL8_9FIRM|nr:bifunctional hydroxymethylpyrimidine kinase/phosphomethylpyrimidine kinase [Terrisporobacter glycolicus]